MPVYNNEILDDPLAFDGSATFNGGMVSAYRPAIINADAFAFAKNMDIDRAGTIVTRPGIALLSNVEAAQVQGLHYYDTPDIERLLAVVGGKLYYSANRTAWTQIAGFTTLTGRRVEFAQIIDKAYIADGGQRLFQWDGTTLTEIAPPTFAKALDAGFGFIVNHTNRLFAAGKGSESDTLIPSDLLDGTRFEPTNKIRIGGGEGEAITGIASWQGYDLAVFKSNSVYVVTTDPQETLAANWIIRPIHKSIGCVNHRTIKQVGTDLFFLSRDGIRTLNRTQYESQYGISDPLSGGVDDYIQRINWNAVDKASAIFWKNRYILAVPIDASSTPNICLVFNTLSKSFAGVWTGWTPRMFVQTRFNDSQRMAFGDASGNYNEFFDYKTESEMTPADYKDGENEIESKIRSKAYNFGETFSPKTGYHLECEFSNLEAVQEQTTIDVILDQGDAEPAQAASVLFSVNQLPVDLPFDLMSVKNRRVAVDLMKFGQFREIQVEVTCTKGKMVLHSIQASAFVDTIEEQTT